MAVRDEGEPIELNISADTVGFIIATARRFDAGEETLEADDFLVDVPSEYTGVVREMKVRLRDRITPGAVILMVEETQEAGSEAERANSLSATIHKK